MSHHHWHGGFAAEGISAKADEYCGLYKTGVLRAVSVGFNAIEMEPIKNGGWLFKEWELCELSCVAVPCDPDAVVTARALPHSDDGRTAVSKDAGAANWKCGASLNLPILDTELCDGRARALIRIFEKAGFNAAEKQPLDVAWTRKAFLAYDAARGAHKGAYEIPFADLIEGRLTVTKGTLAAASIQLRDRKSLPDELSRDIPDDVLAKARAVLDHYEAKFKESSEDGKNAMGAAAKTFTPKFKGLYGVARLAYLVEELGWEHFAAEMEAEIEGDGSKVPAMLADALQTLAAALIAMTQEEVGEMLAGHGVEIVDLVDDDSLTEKSKRIRTAFTKAGRVLSQENSDHLEGALKCLGKAATKSKALREAHDGAAANVATAMSHVKKLAEAPEENGDKVEKCMKCLDKALNGMDEAGDVHDQLENHFHKAETHVKSIKESAKPSLDDAATADAGEAADNELGYEAERRKRIVAVMSLVDAP